MDYRSSQLSIDNLSPAAKTLQLTYNRLKRLNLLSLADRLLLAETILITVAAVSVIKIFQTTALGIGWLVTPGILVAAALIPTIIKKDKLSEIGLSFRQIKYSLVVLGWTCFVVFPAMFCGLWLLKSYGLNLPLRPILPQNQELVSWLFYQFLYVAVAEEVFFRGFLQSNILRLMNTLVPQRHTMQCCISIAISAACFAAAHIILQGRIISVLTFLPGLILGWLSIRTKSLLAPILFHGIANMSYSLIAGALAV